MTKKYLIISIVTVLVLLIGVSLAYYTIQIVGTGSNMVMETAYLRLVLTDNASIVEDAIIPGWSTSKKFTVENKYGAETTYDLLIENFQNTFVTNGFLQFKIESEKGYNTISEDNNYINVPKSQTAKKLVIAHNIRLDKDTTHEYTISFRYKDSEENQAADMQKVLSGNIGIQNGTENTDLVITDLDSSTLKYHILSDNGVYNTEWAEERTSFSSIYDSSTNTFFRTNNAELGETVLYYAGNARNNWVIFGKCANANYNCTVGDDLYWRIIRTNEKSTGGGIRLLYSGSGKFTDSKGNKIIGITENGYIGSSKWHSGYNRPDDVSYTKSDGTYISGTTTTDDIRGNSIDSYIKIKVDAFYESTFLDTNYEDYIDFKTLYCNDRSGNITLAPGITFGFKKRVLAPSYACGASTTGFKERTLWYLISGNSKEDRYTASEYKISETDDDYFGNGWLDYPIALMTADEVAFAGGKYGNNNQLVWYFTNNESNSITGDNYWWTMSPSFFSDYSISNSLFVYGSSQPGYLDDNHRVSYSQGTIRPVLSLTANTKWLSGNGTPDSPYQVKLEN